MERKRIKHLILFLAYCFHRNNNSKVIYYHDVGKKFTEMGTDLQLIRRHVEMINEFGYEIVKEISLPKGQIMVCFDDGWAGLYEARDFFAEHKVYPTVFLAVDLIDKPGYLSLSQILELQQLGFCFESHTWSHYDLTTLDDHSLWHELVDSKKELSQLLDKDVRSLCFPKGRFSDNVRFLCFDSGYEKLYSSISGGYYDLLESHNLICRNLAQDFDEIDFKFMLNSSSKFLAKRLIKQQYQK